MQPYDFGGCAAESCPARAEFRLAFFDCGELVSEHDMCELHAAKAVDRFEHSELRGASKDAPTSLGIPCEVGLVVMAYDPYNCAVYLQELGGTRVLPFESGGFDTWALYWALRRPASPRPGTHQAFVNTLMAMGGKLTGVVVDELLEPDGVFTAKLHILQDERLTIVDLRPSDAVCLAAVADVPIFVREDLLNAPSP